MPVITKITTQIKKTDRYNVYIDEKYAFSVDEEVLIKFELKKGKEIDSLLLSQIQFQDEIQKSFGDALGYLSYRMRSEAEIRLFLKKKDIEDPIINEVVHKLHQHNYINDLDFAKAYVKTYANSGSKGPITLQLELKQKGINDSFINQALSEYPFDVQVQHAKQIAVKSIKKEKNTSERALKQKIEQMLSRKGYTQDCILVVLKEVTLEKDEDEQWEALCFHAEKVVRRYQTYEGFQFQQKVKQALYRKGFPLDLIDKYLSDRTDAEY